jgi:hypothetical protein
LDSLSILTHRKRVPVCPEGEALAIDDLSIVDSLYGYPMQ